MFRVGGILLEADWFKSLENVGNASENLPGETVTAVVVVLKKTTQLFLGK